MVSCKHGAKVTACVTDIQNMLFQCSDGNQQFYEPFDQGKNLECSSPEDTEYLLKACKRGEVVQVTECRYADPSHFTCTDVMGKGFDMPMSLMDNYFCISPQHRKRMDERCRNQ